ncbi:general substrate transporter [Xylogone sp. PMI_703]|nr:general substrate transporter [Xylogone sp. PMI_703]
MPPSTGTIVVGGQEYPKVTWYKDRALIHLHLLCGILLLSSATNGYDGSMMNGLQTLSYWQNTFNHPSASTLGLLNAIFSVGQVVGLPLVPYLADHIGRKWTILVGSSLIFLGVVLQTVAINIGMFIAARFIIGLGIVYTQSCSPMLIAELSHPQYRARLTTIYNTLWYLGSIIASWTTYGTLKMHSEWSWKAPSILQAFPSVIQLFFIWLVPESPRYHIVKGRHEVAKKIFQKYHGPASGQDFVESEYQEVFETMELERQFASHGISELWATKGNRHRLLIVVTAGIFSQTAGSSLVSYYIFLVLDQIGITDSNTQLIINGCITIFNMLIATSMAFTVDHFGRRPLFLSATFGMCLAMTGWTIASQQNETKGTPAAGRAVIALIFVFNLFYNFAWSGLLIGYVVEISPFYLRSRYLTILLLSVAAGLFFSNYVNPVALSNITWKWYLCYIIWLIIQCVVVYFFYIETKGHSLETTAICFEGEDAKIGGEAATAKGRDLLSNLDDKRVTSHLESVQPVNNDEETGAKIS